MNLDIFNNLLNKSKENNVIQNFIKEISEMIDSSTQKSKSLEERVLDGRKLTTKYRDEIKVQRHEIINNYSKENSEQGELYYVYSKRSDNTYGVVMHKNGETRK